MSSDEVNLDIPPTHPPARRSPRLSSPWLAVHGLQHVLVMYTGCVAVPLVFGQALGLPEGTIGLLVSADLFVAGVVTLVQVLGVGRLLGARMPVVAGASFTAVTPMVLIGQEYGLSAVYGSMIAAGVFGLLVAVPFATIARFFPPVVRGAAILMIGLSLIGKAIDMIVGEAPSGAAVALAAGVVLVVVALMRFGRGLLARAAVLVALVLGSAVGAAMSLGDFSGVASASWVGLPPVLLFGAPTFPVPAIVSMCLVMLVVYVESTSYLLATGEIVARPVGRRRLAGGLAGDGLSAVLGGVLTAFPDTVFAQNVSLLRLTGVTSRAVVGVAGGMLVVLGLVPKVGAVVAGLPQPVVGAVSLVMFATVAVIGIRTLATVDLDDNANLVVLAPALGVGMIPVLAPDVYDGLPSWARLLAGGAITSTVIVAFVLNLVVHHLPPRREGRERSAQ